MKQFGTKAGECIEKVSDRAVLIMGTVLFVVLSYYSMRFTELFREGTEIIETHHDSVAENLLALLGVLLLFSAIRWQMDKWEQERRKKAKDIVKIAALIYVAVISICWVAISHVYPRADAGTISLAAELIGKGEYSTMLPHGYLGHNPHQYGLALILEILYFFFGQGNYLSFAYLNALCMPLLVYAGYRILHGMFENDVMEIFYFLLMAVCGPLYVYVLHIYGEVSSTTFCMVLIWQVIDYCKTQKRANGVGAILSAALACTVRMNSLIVVIAAGIVLSIRALKDKKLQAILLMLIMFLSIFGSNAGIKKMYELRTGVEVGKGIPHISYILMGLEDTEAGPGWFNGTNYTEYAENAFDHDATAQSSMEKTKLRLKELWSDKGAAFGFFKRKILTQWNAPDYNSFYTVEKFTCEAEELPGITKSIFMGNLRDFLEDFFDGYQFVIYIGVTVLLIGGFSRKNPIENHLLMIAIIGGFLFSILWEAMSRYVIPYMAFSIPLAAAGLYLLQDKLRLLWKRTKREEKIKRVGAGMEKFCATAVLALGALLFAILSLYSVTQTEIYREGTEIMETHKDSVIANIAVLLATLLLLSLIRKVMEQRTPEQRRKIKDIVKCVVILGMTLVSVLWVAISHVAPRADAGILCDAARAIREGDFSTMLPHGYMGHFPHQYGMVLLLEIIFFCFGTGNYIVFAYFNALCVPLLVYAGYKILHDIFENEILEIYYFLFMSLCGPLYLYVAYVYGEVSSVAFAFVLIWQTMRYCRTGSRGAVIGMALSAAFACMVRMNSMVTVIAVSIALLFYAMRKCKEEVLLVIACLFLAVWGVNAGVRTIYEVKSGVKIEEGMPSSCWVLMGLEDSEYGPGWFDSTNYRVFEEYHYDSEETDRACGELIRHRLKELTENGEVGFWKRKILTQWNSPDYNGFDAVESFDCEEAELPAVTQNIFTGNLRSFLDGWMDRYQSLIYIGAAAWLTGGIFRKRRKEAATGDGSVENYILIISVIGGLLLSMMWEAKSRYIFPYMLFTVPLGAAGFYMLQEWLCDIKKMLKKS